MTNEIKIRNIRSNVLLEIDARASKKKLSREEYLRQLLETHVMSDVVAYEVNRYSELVEKVLLVTEKNSRLYQEILPILDEVTYGKTKSNLYDGND